MACLAGVSPAAVSVVLNHKENCGIFVSQTTRKRILKVIAETGYAPRKSAKDLFARKTNVIGVICHRLTPFFAQFLTHIQQAATEKNLEVIPYLTNGKPELEEKYLQQVLDGRVDGLIALARTRGSRSRYLRYTSSPYHLHIVYYGAPIPGIPTFHFNEKQAGELAFEHLYEVGCRRLAVLGGCIKDVRIQSFVQVASAAGVKVLWPDYRYWVGYLQEAAMAARQLLEKSLPFDGVFCYNDLVGLAFLGVAQQKGIRIPEDIAVITCDNTELTGYTQPPLSSIDVNFPLLARTAIEKVCGLIEGKKEKTSHTLIPVKLLVRESTRRSTNFPAENLQS